VPWRDRFTDVSIGSDVPDVRCPNRPNSNFDQLWSQLYCVKQIYSHSNGLKFLLIEVFCVVGHSLEEIRVRALQNIVSKLDHGLLCDSDLVQEKHLHIRLLEWFNFMPCVLQDDVLSLILRLTKVSHHVTSTLNCKPYKLMKFFHRIHRSHQYQMTLMALVSTGFRL